MRALVLAAFAAVAFTITSVKAEDAKTHEIWSSQLKIDTVQHFIRNPDGLKDAQGFFAYNFGDDCEFHAGDKISFVAMLNTPDQIHSNPNNEALVRYTRAFEPGYKTECPTGGIFDVSVLRLQSADYVDNPLPSSTLNHIMYENFREQVRSVLKQAGEAGNPIDSLAGKTQ